MEKKKKPRVRVAGNISHKYVAEDIKRHESTTLNKGQIEN